MMMTLRKGTPSPTLPISPLVGEMPGRAEGGAKDRRRSFCTAAALEYAYGAGPLRLKSSVQRIRLLIRPEKD
ncbi:MAG: hypothetical protein E5X59_28385 [Mesorhizobium sp.]|nr:MAG: hypothetical protein E5X59_28385 [Mesorhizobium sp.]